MFSTLVRALGWRVVVCSRIFLFFLSFFFVVVLVRVDPYGGSVFRCRPIPPGALLRRGENAERVRRVILLIGRTFGSLILKKHWSSKTVLFTRLFSYLDIFSLPLRVRINPKSIHVYSFFLSLYIFFFSRCTSEPGINRKYIYASVLRFG